MKKIIILTLILSMNGIVSCLYMDECPEPSLYFLRDVKTTAFEIHTSTASFDTIRQKVFVDTLRNQLSFEMELFVEFAQKLSKEPLYHGLMNVAYGCVDTELQNPILPEKSFFSTNKPINLDYGSGATITCIEEHENLLEDERIAPYITFPNILEIGEEMIIEIDLQPEFVFEKDDYEFYFRWEASDGTVLTDTISVFLDL